MRSASLVLVLLLAACGERKESAPSPSASPPAPPSSDPTRVAPTREQCERAADHLSSFVLATLVPDDAAEADRKYVTGLVAQHRESVVSFCLATSSTDEVECMIAASDFPTLAACERFRRQVPPDLLERDHVTEADCELFFHRLRQFKLAEGVAAADIDEDRAKIVETCRKDAKPGTLICFLTARSYEQARRCP